MDFNQFLDMMEEKIREILKRKIRRLYASGIGKKKEKAIGKNIKSKFDERSEV